MIQAEMFRRILDSTPQPSILLAELLEETGNRYLDYSELVSDAAKEDLAVEEHCIPLAIDRIVNR